MKPPEHDPEVPECPACVAGLPPKVLVTIYDPATRQAAGKTVDHEEWCRLKYLREGGMEN
jgi:hypothetical protein